MAAVRQVTVEGHSVPEVAKRLGITTKSLYDWKRVYGESPQRTAQIKADQAENQRLRRELKRVTEERDGGGHTGNDRDRSLSHRSVGILA